MKKKKCITIVFSRNRALQCNLLLTSLFRHCKDVEELSDIWVLYRNNPLHEKSYATLKNEFLKVNFYSETSFKENLLQLVNKTNISFIMFLVDDSVFTNDFYLHDVFSSLDNDSDALGFSLRLGLNTSICFPYNVKQEIPAAQETENKNIVKYNWQKASYDFGYPLELSSSVYRKNDIVEILQDCQYDSPNFLESRMAESYICKSDLLMFKKSVCFSMPLNLVQHSHINRNAGFSTEDFNKLYNESIRIDVSQFDNYVSKGAHDIPDSLKFVKKE